MYSAHYSPTGQKGGGVCMAEYVPIVLFPTVCGRVSTLSRDVSTYICTWLLHECSHNRPNRPTSPVAHVLAMSLTIYLGIYELVGTLEYICVQRSLDRFAVRHRPGQVWLYIVVSYQPLDEASAGYDGVHTYIWRCIDTYVAAPRSPTSGAPRASHTAIFPMAAAT